MWHEIAAWQEILKERPDLSAKTIALYTQDARRYLSTLRLRASFLNAEPGSPAADQIPRDACHPNGITNDQRGVKRPHGAELFCDIGAYES